MSMYRPEIEPLKPHYLSDQEFSMAVLGCVGFPALVNETPELRRYLAAQADTAPGARCISGYSPAFGEPPSYFSVDWSKANSDTLLTALRLSESVVLDRRTVPKRHTVSRTFTTQLHRSVVQHLVEDISDRSSTVLGLREQENTLGVMDGFIDGTLQIIKKERVRGLVGMDDTAVGFFAAHSIENNIRKMLAQKAKECNSGSRMQNLQYQEYQGLVAHVVGNFDGAQQRNRSEADIVQFLNFVDYHLQEAKIMVMLSSLFQRNMKSSTRNNPEQVLGDLYVSHIPEALL
ncbi:MAG: hypothetical protein NUV65_02830 [Candidatus Roizmanbacteria bacterium]|nr:hypothetical protein [Candidatus Roizmanbacteria bacterium]